MASILKTFTNKGQLIDEFGYANILLLIINFLSVASRS